MQFQFLLRYFFFIFITGSLNAQVTIHDRNRAQFIPNKGQWPKEVNAQLHTDNARIWILKNGLRFALRGPGSADTNDFYVFTERFEGSKETEWVSMEPTTSVYNFFINGTDERVNVKGFKKGRMENLYPGVTLIFEVNDFGELKTTWISEEPDQLKLLGSRFEGVNDIESKSNHLLIDLPVGKLIIDCPIAKTRKGMSKVRWREKNGVWQPVSKKSVLIDPVYRFSTFSGSISDNFGYTATYDNRGRTWVGGIVFGGQFPIFNGIQSSYAGGATDVALMLFTSDGTGLISGTFFGGSNREQPHSMIASQNGDLYVLGVSGSPNLGVSFNAYDTAFNGGSATFGGGQTFNLGTDIFVLRLDSLGSTKKGLTYFGGSGNDGINELGTLNYGDEARGEIVTTSTGVYIASSTNSLDFPQTLGVNYNGGQDGVLFKMSLDLDSLIWSSYYGGSNLDALFGLVAVESQNEDYLYSIGVSKSDSLADLGSFQPQRGGNEDAWIIRVNSNTGQLEKSSYFGGGDRDFGYLLSHNYLGSHKAVGDSNSLVFVGNNLSYIDSINTSWSQSNSSQHIVWVSKNLDSILRVQTFGDGNFANQDLSPTALMLDDCGSLYFSGWGGITNTVGNTNTLFVTPNALQNGTDGNDFYFLVLGRDGYPLYASFFGGISNEHVDGGTSRFDPNGIIHQAICAGCGGNSNLPIFPHNAFSSTNGSTNCNMAAVQISFELQSVRLNLNVKSDTICENSLVELIGSTIRCDSTFISWGDGQTSFAHNPIGETHFYNQSGNYTISIVGFDTVCETSYTQNLNLFVSEPRNLSADVIIDYDLCDSSLFISLTPVDSSLGQIYKVFWGDGNDDFYINNDSIYHYYNDNYQPIDISVVAIDSICGLTDTNNFTIKFHPEMDEIEAEAFVNPCSSLPSIFFSGNSLNSTKLFWYPYGANTDTLVGTEVSWQVQTAGDYTVEVFAWDSICDKWISSSFTYSVVSPVIDSLKFPNVFTPNNDGLNDDFKVISTGIESIEIFNLEVFNRWGQKVFTTSDPHFLWDGSYRGRNLSSGVYFWIAKWKTVCGSKGNTTGDVLINTN